MPQPSVTQPKLSNTEFNSLHDFYNATNGPFWRWHNVSIHSAPWNFSIPHVNPCEANWQGLICSCGLTSCSVSQIFLDHHNVAGHLPDSMRNFQQMTSLILRSNNISGTITASIGNMTDLEELDLSYNRLYGEIPSSIGRLWKLKTLNLGVNRLTKIPEALYDLSNLEALDIILNRISSSISPRLGNLTRLKTLQFQGNGFTGEIPDSIRGLQRLKTLDLSDNNLRGVLPDGFYELHNLTSCIITSNRLSGTIPPEIGFLKKLRTLELSFNYLSWTVPSEIGDLSKLNILYLNRNYFVGTIPLSFANLTELRTFDISSNNLYGPVGQLAGMNFTLLYLYENLFSGRFSLSSSFFQNILYLDLSQNSFTGPLPWREDVYSRFITWYQSTSNFFDGTFPNSALTPNLRYYLLGDNLMSGSLPSHFLSNSTSLYYLAISQNYFFGPVPDSIGDLRQLNQVFMDVNMLSGPIPETLNRLLNLVVLDLDENLLSGPIPTNITRLRFLQELMIQNNLLTGSLDILLNSTNLHYMENIDVSGNLFTGTLSPQFFTNSKQLASFAAGGNCLKGKIPDTICEAKTIVSLTLDGLTTAENCREYLFSGLSSQFNGFIVNRYLGSSIPTCLFGLPEIELLHLSGNGFSGTLPETLSISSTLNDLSLSYNALEGTIPDVIQKRTWDLLDLSYNKLSGTLHSSLSSGVLYLEVNRLSGTIPSSVLDTATISMLNGNIFECDTFRADLPSNDPDYSKYSCGSDSANDVLYAWLGALLIVPILLLVVWRVSYGLQLSMGAVLNKIAVWRNALKSDDPKKINLLRLSIYLHEVRKTVVVISLYSIVVLIPIYVSLTVTSPSYTYQYAWSISAMLVKGETSAIALFFSLFVVVLLFFTLIQRVLLNIDREAPKSEDRSISVSSARSEGEEKDDSWLIGLTYVVVSLLNVLMMGVSDFTYVYILLNYSTVVVSLSALVLALFRLGTNNFLLWSALPLTYRWVSVIREKVCGAETYDRSKFRFSSSRYTTQDIHFLENLTLFNNIIIPGLAIVFTLPDCFYNALYAAGSVSSLYYYESCEQYIAPIGYGHFCSERFKILSYSPPYIYSFQCSSKIVINYVEVYVIMFILTALVIPLLKIALKLIYEKLKEREANLSISSQSLTTASSLSTEGTSWRMSSWRGKVIRTYLLEYFKDFQMNSLDKDVANEEGLSKSESSSVTTNKTTSKRKKKKRNKRLFSKLSLTTRINSYLTIMMCFGVLFPPLAVIAAISICSVTYFEELCIGWVLTETRRLGAGYEWYEEQIERECGGVEESSNLTIWSTLVVSCGLYGYVIFDTMGDESGWEAALPIALLMFSTPLMLFLGLRSISLVQSAFSKEKEMNEENVSMEGNVDTSLSNSYIVGDSSIEMISTEVKSPLVVE